jgi:uncharacterized protein (DUF2267 family)
MSTTGLPVFDKTLQTTNVWLGEIEREIGPDRQIAWKVLSTVLHKLRDRLPVELSAHLGSQLPLLVRGVYYDQYQPARQPANCSSLDEFVDEVADWLSDVRPVNPKTAVDSVFRVLSHHLDPGQVGKVRQALPKSLRQLWESIEGTPPPVH